MKRLLLTTEELQTIINMMEFATVHAEDGMSPAMNVTELLENAKNDVMWAELYKVQQQRIIAAKKALANAIDTPVIPAVTAIQDLQSAKLVIVNMLEFFRDENLDVDKYYTVAEEVQSAKEILIDANFDELTSEQVDKIKRA